MKLDRLLFVTTLGVLFSTTTHGSSPPTPTHQNRAEITLQDCPGLLGKVQAVQKMCTETSDGGIEWSNATAQAVCLRKGIEAALANYGPENIAIEACQWGVPGTRGGIHSDRHSTLCFENAVKFFPESGRLKKVKEICTAKGYWTLSKYAKCFVEEMPPQ